MKKNHLILLTILFVSPLSFATPPQDCLQIANTIDRKYCFDKYLETVRSNWASEKMSWGKELTPEVKASEIQSTQEAILAKKDFAALIAAELALDEQFLAELQAAATVAPTKAAAPKKKKKKKNFFEKLKG